MNSQSGETHKQNKTGQRSDKVPSIPRDPSSVSDIPTSDAEKQTGNKSYWQRKHYHLQAALGLLGVIAVVIYSCQLYEMQKATKAATDGLALTREMNRIDQRAWVAPKAMNGKAEVGKPFIVTIAIKNTGKTFAKNFVGGVSWTAKYISDPDPNFEEATERTHAIKSVALLAPDAEINLSLNVPADGRKLVDEDLETFNDPTRVFYCFGKLTYTDIFKCDHWTTFCWRLYPSTGGNAVHEAYNDADDNECL